ncbi:SRPBCC domain-containing protein [Sphingomonas sp. JC676]|uniref:SRPBCC family protein n=1 Tax=Sphingomonas sp. JC676 TaxID=2768065 RepID=UPI001657D34F|nr:SRPBCC domain-containing protein [Sphingomonas sp. JC676]MBC9033607.1 SRPBCC domain-containing protein [Sphingomonas sp. JC676]
MKRAIPFGLLLALFATPAAAEVVQSSDTSFSVSHKLTIAAPPERVWQAVIRPSLWWQGGHTYSGDANNISLDPRAGGCWCEKTVNGGVEHMRVVYVAAPAMLRLTGALGPLQAMPVTGVMTIELKPQGAGTEATLTYAVAGPGGLAQVAAPVDGVLGLQWAQLKAAAEKRP